MKFLVSFLGLLFATTISGEAAHPVLICDSGNNRVCVVSADGKIEWEYPAVHPQDCWRLPNGNYLFCFRDGALELTPGKEKVWEYRAPAKTEVHACQPLPDGRVMLVECGSSRILEVDHEGKIAKEIKLTTAPEISTHEQFRGTRKTKDGHYLVCFKGEHKVVELDENGKTLREIKAPGDVHEAVLLPEDHLLITCGDGHKVIEIDAAGKVVWELNENDLPGNPLRLMAGCQRLPNGNTVFVNYLGHGHGGEQAHLLEVTRDKKIVWAFDDRKNFKALSQVQLLDVPGDVTKGEILR
jgi:outer membrane protein assembly factor BamB